MKTRKVFLCLAVAAAAFAAAAEARAADIDTARKAVGDSLAEVSFYMKYDEGDAPYGFGGWSGDSSARYSRSSGSAVDNEEPMRLMGFLVDSDLVLTWDPEIQDRFVKKIVVTIGDTKYDAAMDRFALANKGLFLKLSSPVAAGKPLAFDARAAGPYAVVNFDSDRDNKWIMRATDLPTDQVESIGGTKYIRVSYPSLIINKKGRVAGAAMTWRLPAESEWRGSPLLWNAISKKDFDAKVEAVKKAAQAGLVQVTVNFRATQSRRLSTRGYSYEDRNTPTELQAVGLILGPGKVLVLADMSRRDTAKVESMSLTLGDKSVPLTIEGALSRYGAIMAKYDGALEGAAPLAAAEVDFAKTIDALMVADMLSYDEDARDERFARDRVSSIYDGFLGLGWPATGGNSQGALLFTMDGKLATLPIKVREQIAMRGGGSYSPSSEWGRNSVNMPAARLADVLADAAAVDATFKPLTEEEAKRFVWLGIETQEMTRDLARAKNASLATKGGKIGALVTYVYKDSPADKAGIKAGDILVRLNIPGQVKPVDVEVREEREFEFPWAELDQIPDMYFEQLPRPWPDQNNELARVLTEVGAGRTVAAEFVAAGGEKRAVDFALEMGPKDFNSATSYEDKASGLTVKDATYEVRHYFKMKDDDPGIVVSDIVAGSKASVAGLKPCEVITAVNGQGAKSVEDFKKSFAAGGDIALTVKRMSRSRVVKISLPRPAREEAKGAEAASTDSTISVKPAAPGASTESAVSPAAEAPAQPAAAPKASEEEPKPAE